VKILGEKRIFRGSTATRIAYARYGLFLIAPGSIAELFRWGVEVFRYGVELLRYIMEPDYQKRLYLLFVCILPLFSIYHNPPAL
jgi:hypothetical protein